MGNSESNFCQNSNYMCNIFPIKNNDKRKSITMHIKNKSHSSFDSSIPISSQNQIENGGKIYDLSNSSYFKKQNKNSQKFFLLNPNTKQNKEIKLNNICKTITRIGDSKETMLFQRNNSSLNIKENKKILIIPDLKHNFENKSLLLKNDNIRKKIKLDFQYKNNISYEEEEDTINNLSQEEISINSNHDSLNNSPKINVKINNEKINENEINDKKENENENKINYKKENENINNNEKENENNNQIKNEENNSNNKKGNENYCQNEKEDIKNIIEKDELNNRKNCESNRISEKDIELFEKSFKSNSSKEKDIISQKNILKGLKIFNFKYSNEFHNKKLNKGHSTNRGISINNFKDNNNHFDKRINSSSHSIPDKRHIDSNKPLNYFTIKRQIKSSLCPLNKNSFNIIFYKEDNSKQYSYFKNGIANGITKYIINQKNSIVFEGEFENGYPKGYGKYSLRKEGRKYEGIWDKEIILGIEEYRDGTVYMGDFKNNKKEGIGIYRWPDGTIYYGEWKSDNMDGFCHIKYFDDRLFTGQIENGRKNGYGEFSWKPTRKYIGNYTNDLKEGFGIYIWNIKSFQVFVGFWHEGKMEGIGLMINGDKRYYGKWYEGEKVECFKNEKDLEMKYKSTKLKMANNLIRRRSMINIQNDKNKIDIKINNNKYQSSKKIYQIKAKHEIEKCINFLCKDFKFIKCFIMKLFINSNKF